MSHLGVSDTGMAKKTNTKKLAQKNKKKTVKKTNQNRFFFVSLKIAPKSLKKG